jgi:uncharacterized delta-60 repeat protein
MTFKPPSFGVFMRSFSIFTGALALLCAFAGGANAQTRGWVLDKSHNGTGHVRTLDGTAGPRPVAVLAAPNGEIVRVLAFPGGLGLSICPSAAGTFCPVIRKHRSDGTQVFTTTPTLAFSFSALPRGAAIDAQGRVYVAGSRLNSSGNLDFFVVRFLPDGNTDSSFNFGFGLTFGFDRGGNLNDVANAIAVDSQGRPVVVGEVTFGAADTDFGVARLTVDGQLDSTFDGDGLRTVPFDLGISDLTDKANAVSISSFGGTEKIFIGGDSVYRASAGATARSVRLILVFVPLQHHEFADLRPTEYRREGA